MFVDAPSVGNASEASFLMRYHLQMAASYFEATDAKWPDTLFADEFSETAMVEWAASMEKLYPNDEDN